MWLKMVLKDGFLHADLHPGNILVRAAEVGYGFQGRTFQHITVA